VTHNIGIPHSPTGQSIVEWTHQTLKRVLQQQKGSSEINSPVLRLYKALFTINFLNNSFEDPNPPVNRHFQNTRQQKLKENPPVLVKDPETLKIQGPYQLHVYPRP
ncbi:POK19 protein, partial [Dyaphorophyia castanea]|nr:POK19 protein [Platysteira castanea]